MSFKGHLRVFSLATLVWAGFWLLGLPDYYQQYSARAMFRFDALLLLPIVLVFAWVLRRLPRGRRIKVSLWYAFYFTVPLFLYDWLYCGVYLDHGMGFLTKYWHLTVYYAIPWIVLPVVARVENARDGAAT